tara:strand:+ start:5654 stop:6313 length:660 start_codon:yes stop_codon:yes gene_type:complete
MSDGETGLETLIDSGRLDETPHFPEVKEWCELLAIIEELTNTPTDYKTLIIDTINGLEALCFNHVCRRDFKGSMKAFLAYGQGPESSVGDWRQFLAALDELRERQKMAVICLCHSHVKPFHNPEGEDYDRYTPELHKKLWGATHKWADIVLFFHTPVAIDAEGLRAKGKGGLDRVAFTTKTPAWDAKNRHGMPEEFELGESGAEGWSNFINTIKQGKDK